MSFRLTRIYTRTGDTGSTGLGDGTRLPKDAPRIEALGVVDELNSALGMVLAEPVSALVRDTLTGVQHDLFDLGGELSIPGYTAVSERHIARLEEVLDRFNAELPPLADFILPGGERAAACCHLARTLARRAERRIVTLAGSEVVSPLAQQYLNRLSDLLFVLCRVVNRDAG
ncbi:MAG: cob(I)yrinic acid a,c-diamide adenosyltransferase, partial [Proteobacteria bacterium]|nr:cob(I)yrinic acid a,c-diamide adenosyltransferase [Burkholderiales bacterium]